MLKNASKSECKHVVKAHLSLLIKFKNVKSNASNSVRCFKRSRNKWPAKLKINVLLRSKPLRKSVLVT